MLSITNLKNGVVIDLDGIPFEVIKYQHAKLGRSGGILRTTLKNLITGANIEKTFKGDAKLTPADIRRSEAQFLYQEGSNYIFMDSSLFEQFTINQSVLGSNINFLTEGQKVDIRYFKDMPININLPIKMKFRVVQAEPAVKGDTVSSPNKNAVIETGLQIKVPLFVKVDDIILVDTRTSSYIERVNV